MRTIDPTTTFLDPSIVVDDVRIACRHHEQHVDPHHDAYGAELAREQLRYACTSTAAATTIAENYVGLPFDHATLTRD